MQNITKHIMTTFYQLIWLSSLYLKLSRTAMEEVVEEVVVVEMGGQKSVGDADMIGTDRWDDECLTSRIINTRSPSQCHLWFSDLRIKQPDCHHQPPSINKHLILSSSSTDNLDPGSLTLTAQSGFKTREIEKFFNQKQGMSWWCKGGGGRGGEGLNISQKHSSPIFSRKIKVLSEIFRDATTVLQCDCVMVFKLKEAFMLLS